MPPIKKQRQTPSTVLWSVLFGILVILSASCDRKASPIQPDVPPVVEPEEPGTGTDPKDPSTPPTPPTPPDPQSQSLSLTGEFVSYPAFEEVPCGVLVALERDV